MKTRLLIVLAAMVWVASGLGSSNTALAHGYLAQCVIGFDDQFALQNVYAQARTTFAYHTGADETGNDLCDESAHGMCWTYRERCGSRGYVRVQEAPNRQYDHFHLSFEDDALTCFAENGDGLGKGFGRPMNDGSCAPANWKREPRFVSSHTAEHLIHIWVEDQETHKPRIFELASIHIKGAMSARIWYKKSDGKWYFWSTLAPGRWNLSGYLWDITDVMIRAADGSGSSVSFDDVVIRN